LLTLNGEPGTIQPGLQVMERNKLFYVTNAELPPNEPGWSLALQKLGFEERTYFIMGDITRWQEILGRQGISGKFFSAKKASPADIIGKAREEKASLITVNLSSDGMGISRKSMTRSLIRFTQVPLLLIPEVPIESVAGTPDQDIFDHVIFATDWSPFSQKSMETLSNLKENINELEIVTVINKKLSIRDMIGLKDMLEETRSQLLDQGIDAEGHVYAGKPSEEILLTVKDYGGTVIVMDASHRSALKTFFYGNCTYEVADKAEVPILVIP